MEITSPRIRSLLRQADKVAADGKRAAAEKLYRQIIEEAPGTAAAWAGLGNVLRSPTKKEESYQHALELDPENTKAQAGLAQLSGEVSPLDPVVEVATIEGDPAGAGNETGPGSRLMSADDSVIVAANEDSAIAHEESLPTAGHEHLVIAADRDDGVLFCANHPNRETHLRCNRCNKPICSSCANRTPVGYRCPECIREQEDKFFSASTLDYFVTIIVALPLSLIAGWIATFLGFWSIFLGAFAGSLIGRLAFRAAGRRRGRGMPLLVGAMVVLGAVIPALFIFLGSGRISIRILFTGIYIVTASGAAYYQMR